MPRSINVRKTASSRKSAGIKKTGTKKGVLKTTALKKGAVKIATKPRVLKTGIKSAKNTKTGLSAGKYSIVITKTVRPIKGLLPFRISDGKVVNISPSFANMLKEITAVNETVYKNINVLLGNPPEPPFNIFEMRKLHGLVKDNI